ncbi:MAG TPA: PD-(D/E)XK nuclease family protein [Draconibacterium sp.]|nr:PD-(D/E)XK nuclease family protein [Draconibacterium sp.]
MERFLSQCAKYIYEHHSQQLKDICLVFPNRRSGVFFTSYLQKEINQPVIGPKVTTVNELISGYSDWHSGDKLQLISILYDVFCKHTHTTETFDEFYFWGEILLADFNDIDRYLVNAKDLFTNISDLKEIESIFDYLTGEQKKALEQFWGSMAVTDKNGFRDKYLSIWDKLYPVYVDFKKQLQEQQLAFPGMIDREVAERIEEKDLKFPYDKYYIIGLNALNACETKMFNHMLNIGKAVFLWDYDKAYWDDDRNEAGHFMRSNLHKFPAPEDFVLNTEIFNNRKSIKLIAVSSVYGQAQQIPYFLKDTEKSYKPEFDNTAVVLADESLLFSALGAIPEEIGTVNITMGYPVRNSVLYGFMMLMVALLKNKRRENNAFVAYHRYVTDILNHQLLTNTEPEKSKQFIVDLKTRNRVTVQLNEIDFSALHQLVFQLPEKTEDYSTYFLRVLGMFYQKQNESENKDLMLMELIYSMYQAIEKLGAVVKATLEKQQRSISETVYFRLFSQYLGQVSVAFEGEPLSGLQVMGILETRCLDFENLVILGLNESKWPRKFTAPSFIPFNIRLGFGLPGIDEQDAMYSYYFYRLIQRAKNVTATYSVVKEGINTGELSRYGFQLRYDSVHKPEMLNLDFVFSNDPVGEIKIESSEATVARLLERNTEDHPLSPSALNTYLSCGLKFYFHYVADLPEPEEVKEEIDGAIFGTIFHDTMEALYAPFKGKVINPGDLERISKDKVLISNEITRQIAVQYLKMKEPIKGPVKLEGKTLLFFENIKTYISQLLKIDTSFAPFSIVSLEEKYKRTIEINGRQIWVGGTIDRLDQKDGITRVLDYKTGNVDSISFKEVAKLFQRDEKSPKKEILQALIYSWGISDGITDSRVQPAIYSLRKLFDKSFDPEIKMDKQAVDFNEIEVDFEAELNALVSEIYSPDTVFTQTAYIEKCKYCPYKGICRKF